ncbi:beta-glucosidase [Methylacidiphilum kamchatkense Kam1]|uniref:beta-glucosidase n=1 Tax=Methylacidiphilum kamchatkense Kam1 TaxID=1202785 RepID=A0A0C1UT13_9BACT|nr:glycoside hydrolase family 3 N-terminal domain-containing protein [Methylacidiphilum kamchatkense]KIE58943.1 beta-glucosidase [Methylacidiphilum kamchatkense Kam1]QDQ43178.1 beta-glucosidase [Methylacidiphilum kamchatkense Kam1]
MPSSSFKPIAPSDVRAILSRMNLEEKIGQLVQLSPKDGMLSEELKTLIQKGKVGSFLNLTDPSQIEEAQRIASHKSRLHIPLLFAFDVLHGFKTIFPIPIALASSMDAELIEQVARASAKEARAFGIHWTFAPMLDVCRDPRWGRVAESPGEDPFLASLLSSAWIKGFQGTNLSSSSLLAACPKHFVGYGAVEGGRDYNSVTISYRLLQEIYLPPFLQAFKQGAFATMAAFVAINGLPPAANSQLLKDLLRKDIGWEGPVISDWNAVRELVHHGIAENEKAAVAIAINSGIDIDMASGLYSQYLEELLKEGKVKEETIDDAVQRVLTLKNKLGLFTQEPHPLKIDQNRWQTILKTNKQIALEAAKKSVVLLKNEDGLLPIAPSIRSIALIGPFSEERKEHLGPWSAIGDGNEVITLAEGLKRYAPRGTKINVVEGCNRFRHGTVDYQQALKIAQSSQLIVAAVGEKANMSGEAASRAFLDFPTQQQQLIEALLETKVPVVLIVFSGRPLDLSRIIAKTKAILQAWFLGTETGEALGQILFGLYNPSGKLPITFPRSVGQIPIYYAQLPTGRPANRSFPSSRYIDQSTTPLFPFGYGLSYTTFHYSFPTLNRSRINYHQTLEIQTEIENTGTVPGEEIVQLYIRDPVASISRPLKELKGIQRVFLNPGEKQKIKFTISSEDLAFIDYEGKRKIEPGRFFLWVGPNSTEGKRAQFDLIP